jgi:hypothetical protein
MAFARLPFVRDFRLPVTTRVGFVAGGAASDDDAFRARKRIIREDDRSRVRKCLGA